MKSLVLTRNGLQMADTPRPPLMPGDVRIEVRAVGICGTDLSIWQGNLEAKLPLILGHEIAGVIDESSVVDIAPGTVVTTEANSYCGRCWYCANDMKSLCTAKKSLGITVDGGLAEYVSVPAESIHPLPPAVDILSGTFVEPLASAIQTQIQCPAKPREIVVVIGSGKLGLLIAQVYDAFGADVYLVGRNQWKLGLARHLGLRNTINSSTGDWKKQILNATSGLGPRLVVEATGNTDGLKMALEIVRGRGVIAMKSIHGLKSDINPSYIVEREVEIRGSTAGSYEMAIDMLAKGRIEVKRLVSKEFSLDEGVKAFEHASQPNVTKVIVRV